MPVPINSSLARSVKGVDRDLLPWRTSRVPSPLFGPPPVAFFSPCRRQSALLFHPCFSTSGHPYCALCFTSCPMDPSLFSTRVAPRLLAEGRRVWGGLGHGLHTGGPVVLWGEGRISSHQGGQASCAQGLAITTW